MIAWGIEAVWTYRHNWLDLSYSVDTIIKKCSISSAIKEYKQRISINADGSRRLGDKKTHFFFWKLNRWLSWHSITKTKVRRTKNQISQIVSLRFLPSQLGNPVFSQKEMWVVAWKQNSKEGVNIHTIFGLSAPSYETSILLNTVLTTGGGTDERW